VKQHALAVLAERLPPDHLQPFAHAPLVVPDHRAAIGELVAQAPQAINLRMHCIKLRLDEPDVPLLVGIGRALAALLVGSGLDAVGAADTARSQERRRRRAKLPVMQDAAPGRGKPIRLKLGRVGQAQVREVLPDLRLDMLRCLSPPRHANTLRVWTVLVNVLRKLRRR
jgi:hypothetical protein